MLNSMTDSVFVSIVWIYKPAKLRFAITLDFVGVVEAELLMLQS